MKKLILIGLLIVGCDNSTEPEPEDCAGVAGGTATLEECVLGNWVLESQTANGEPFTNDSFLSGAFIFKENNVAMAYTFTSEGNIHSDENMWAITDNELSLSLEANVIVESATIIDNKFILNVLITHPENEDIHLSTTYYKCADDIDCVGACGGTDTSCIDCLEVFVGDNVEDNCSVCDNDSSNDCVQDCAGAWGGDAEQKECLLGSWIKVEEGVGITYILTFKEDNTFETEFSGGLDSNPESYGSYSITETQISFYGEGGSAMCESNPGVYNFEIDYNKLTFILINDDCEGRSIAIEGVWDRYNN